MPAKTLEQLRLGSRRRAELTQDADAVSDDELNGYVNEGFHGLYDLIIDADDGRIFSKNAGVLRQVGERAFRLPNDLYRLIAVHVGHGGRYARALRADSSAFAELTAIDNESATWSRPRYQFRWNINTGERDLFVFPSDAGEISIVYFPLPKELVDDDDKIDNPASWIEYVESSAAIKMLDKLERESDALSQSLQRAGERIADAVNDMDMHSPAMVRDTQSYYAEGGRRGSW